MSFKAKLIFCFATLGMTFLAWALGLTPSMKSPGFSFYVAVLVVFSWQYLCPVSTKTMSKILFFVLMTTFTLAVGDTLLRPLMSKKIFYRPHERLSKLHDQYPFLYRYREAVKHESKSHGDLAAKFADTDLREYRRIEYVTDRYGFRNRPSEANQLYSLILLGDSFGVGCGTTQDKIMAEVLTRDYNIPTYNLSQIGSVNQHFFNLQLEYPRLPLKENAVVALLVFGGNDLEERHFEEQTISEFPVNSGWQTFRQKWTSYKRRTVLRGLFKSGAGRSGTFHPNITIKTNCQERVLFLNRYSETAVATRENVAQTQKFPQFQASLENIDSFCRDKKLRLCVFQMPTKAEVYNWMLNGWDRDQTAHRETGLGIVLTELCQKMNAPYRDLGPVLHERAKRLHKEDCKNLLWWRDDSHINEQGHAEIADIIQATLKDLLP